MGLTESRPTEGVLVYIGMECIWTTTPDGEDRFATGMHFRDESFPIKIKRYPDGDTVATESQKLGVITGQFIRAQRTCSTIATFKKAVRQLVQAALRRRYPHRAIDRTWGKFLAKWWSAQEVRRGELRS